MGYTGGDSACLQAVASKKAQAYMTSVMMALKDGAFYDVTVRIYARSKAFSQNQRLDPLLSQKLMALKLDHPLSGGTGRRCKAERLLPDLIYMEGIKHSRKLLCPAPVSQTSVIHQTLPLLGRQHSILVNRPYLKVFQIFKDHQICPQARSNGSSVCETEIPGSVKASHGNGPDGISPQRHRLFYNIVNMPPGQKIPRMAVICDQHGSVVKGLLKQRHERFQVLGGCSLPDHNPLTSGQLL